MDSGRRIIDVCEALITADSMWGGDV